MSKGCVSVMFLVAVTEYLTKATQGRKELFSLTVQWKPFLMESRKTVTVCWGAACL